MYYLKMLFVAMVASVLAFGLAACEPAEDEFEMPDQQYSTQADTAGPEMQAYGDADEGDWEWPDEDDEDDDAADW